jgi:hypothetical protein
MAEAIAGLSLAANIAQFATIGLDLARKTKELIHSASGLLKEDEELIKVVTNLKTVSQRIPVNLATSQAIPKDLQELASTSEGLSDQLLQLLKKLQVRPGSKGRKRESFGRALSAAWYRSEIKELETRLYRVRDEISFHLITTLE